MAVVFADVIEQAFKLTTEDKLALIENLLISLDGDPDAEPAALASGWDEEIAHRIAAIDKGEAEMIDGEEVFARLRAILARPR